MRIIVSDPASADDLVAYLRRCGCSAEVVGRGAVDASPPRANVAESYLRMELDAYLRVWRAMHPTVGAEILGPPADGRPAGSAGVPSGGLR
jgi:hypothetical protein